MSQGLKVFRINEGSVEAALQVPDSLKRVAADTYNGIRAGGQALSQPRVEEMISCCLDIVRRAIAGDESIPPMYFEDDSEVEKLTDYLCRRDDEGYYFASLLSKGDELRPSQMIASYALHKTDHAAQCLLDGNAREAIESLALACQASADYAFHHGFNDYPQMQKEDGWVHAQRSTRLRGVAPTKDYVLARWKEANNAKPWRQLTFAKHIKADVMKFAKDHGWTMVDDNAIRTIRDWIAAEVKRNQPT